MTNAQKRKAAWRADWDKAIAEGRMVRIADPLVFRPYATKAAAAAVVAAMVEDGDEACIVEPVAAAYATWLQRRRLRGK